jgi:hypothetical protein
VRKEIKATKKEEWGGGGEGKEVRTRRSEEKK